jgi:hypothetical protein
MVSIKLNSKNGGRIWLKKAEREEKGEKEPLEKKGA